MTETQTPLPDLTITAVADNHWNVTYAFDGFPVRDDLDAIHRLVKHWRMTREVAETILDELYNEATREDGNQFAEVVLSEDPA